MRSSKMTKLSHYILFAVIFLSFVKEYEATAPLFLSAITSALATIPFTGGPMTTGLVGAKLAVGSKLLYYLGFFGRRSSPKPASKPPVPAASKKGSNFGGVGMQALPLPYALSGAGGFFPQGGGGGFGGPTMFSQGQFGGGFDPAQLFQMLAAQGIDPVMAMQALSGGGGARAPAADFAFSPEANSGFTNRPAGGGGFGSMPAGGGGFGQVPAGGSGGFGNIPAGGGGFGQVPAGGSGGFGNFPTGGGFGQMPAGGFGNIPAGGGFGNMPHDVSNVFPPSSDNDAGQGGSENDVESFFTFLRDMDDNTCISRLMCDIGSDPTFLGEFSENINGIMSSLEVPSSSGASQYIAIMETGKTEGGCAQRFPQCSDAAYEIVKNVAPSVGVPPNIN